MVSADSLPTLVCSVLHRRCDTHCKVAQWHKSDPGTPVPGREGRRGEDLGAVDELVTRLAAAGFAVALRTSACLLRIAASAVSVGSTSAGGAARGPCEPGARGLPRIGVSVSVAPAETARARRCEGVGTRWPPCRRCGRGSIATTATTGTSPGTGTGAGMSTATARHRGRRKILRQALGQGLAEDGQRGTHQYRYDTSWHRSPTANTSCPCVG